MVVKRQWLNCNIPAGVAEAIDKFLETDLSAKSGIHSRSDFITRLCVAWFSNIDKEFSIFDSSRISEIFGKTHPPPILPSQLPKEVQQQPPPLLSIQPSDLLSIIKLKPEMLEGFEKAINVARAELASRAKYKPPLSQQEREEERRTFLSLPNTQQLLAKYPAEEVEKFADGLVEIVDAFYKGRYEDLPTRDYLLLIKPEQELDVFRGMFNDWLATAASEKAKNKTKKEEERQQKQKQKQ
jgi:hypothetical protein